MNPRIERAFPAIRRCVCRETSPADFRYNCIAWAVDTRETKSWWWPSGDDPAAFFPPKLVYWPKGAPNVCTLEGFLQAFELRGWRRCPNSQLRLGYEKAAIYADASGEPTHAARQLPDGTWTSKLGDWEDIMHETLEALEGDVYGKVAAFLERETRR